MTSIPVADVFRLPFPASTFGNRFGIKGPYYGPAGHRGTDFVQPGGKAIPAIANGLVVHTMWSDVLGRVTVIKHVRPNGSVVYSGYCHQSKYGTSVGKVVKIGQTIGYVGTTGSASSGNHLHLTLGPDDMSSIYGTVQDPIAYIYAHDTPTSATPAKPVTAKYTTAKKGEGLSAIATRVKVTLARIKVLNPTIKSPDYVVKLGQKIRIS